MQTQQTTTTELISGIAAFAANNQYQL